jgi:hypothetical protein
VVTRLFLAGLLLAGFVAALEAAPKLLLLGGPGMAGPGSFLDNGSLGLSEAGRVLVEAGYRLYQGLGPVKSSGGVVYLVAGAMRCGADEAAVLAEAVESQANLSGGVGVVVAAGGAYSSCGRLVLEKLGLEPPAYIESLEGAYLVAGTPLRRNVLWALYASDHVEPTGGWRVLVWALGPGGDRVPAVLAVRRDGLVAVFIPSWNAFANAVFRAEAEAGLDPGDAVVDIVDYASQMKRGAVILPSQFLAANETGAPVVAFHPATLTLRAAKAYAGIEERLRGTIASNPLLVAVAAWVLLALLVVPLHFGVGGAGSSRVRERSVASEAEAEAVEVFHLGGWAEVGEALDAVLRAKAGVSLEEAAASPPPLLLRAAARLGLDEKMLRRILGYASSRRGPRLGGRRLLRLARELVDVLVFVEREEGRR